ncbi:MAG TPA: hypothetical protein VNP37_14410 [Actinomycetospora sp.]|nr:hypothetical protein [Actinomycetospora sp.]
MGAERATNDGVHPGRLLRGRAAGPLLIDLFVLHRDPKEICRRTRLMNDAFGTTPLGPGDWLLCVGLASFVLWADEAKKLVERALRAERRRTVQV